MNYHIKIEKAAKKFIAKQNPKTQSKLLETIYQLPEGEDIKKFKGYKNRYRIRCGDIRILYDKCDDILTIYVIDVGNRGDLYKRY